MSRIFRRGELKQAVVLILGATGETHGYAILKELEERIGGGWKPSPGAIYPALLALVESGYVRTAEQDGVRIYGLTEAGQRSAAKARKEALWASLNRRAADGEQKVAVGSLLDRFAAQSPTRRRLASVDQQQEIERILERAQAEIDGLLLEGDGDG